MFDPLKWQQLSLQWRGTVVSHVNLSLYPQPGYTSWTSTTGLWFHWGSDSATQMKSRRRGFIVSAVSIVRFSCYLLYSKESNLRKWLKKEKNWVAPTFDNIEIKREFLVTKSERFNVFIEASLPLRDLHNLTHVQLFPLQSELWCLVAVVLSRRGDFLRMLLMCCYVFGV